MFRLSYSRQWTQTGAIFRGRGQIFSGRTTKDEDVIPGMPSFADKKILIADDSQTMRMFILFHLIKMLPGIRIVEAVSGADALEKLRRMEDVDLILTDMNMPELDGAGLIKAVREELRRDTPMIVITTKGEQKDRDRGIAVGANGYITKPLQIREFRETILKHLFRT